MTKKTIAELLAEAKQLRQKEKELKAQMKAQKQIIAVEYADNLNPEAKQKQIADAEAILTTAKQKAEELNAQFKTAMKKIKEDVAFAKEILAFVNYKQNHSLKRVNKRLVFEGSFFQFSREGINTITIDWSQPNWKRIFKDELAKQGLNGNNRIADNIVYDVGLEVAGEVERRKVAKI